MINPVTTVQRTEPTSASAAQTKPAANSATSSQKPTQSQAASPARPPVDTVQISIAAQAAQEVLETSAQTAKEAALGDPQAQRLLARELVAEKRQ